MINRRTIYDVLQLLEEYDDERRVDYERPRNESTDPLARILLEHLVMLEDHSLQVIRGELVSAGTQNQPVGAK